MANITLYDVNGECVRSLTQWDHDVSLKIRGVKTDPVPEVRCSNKNSTLASRVSATIIDDCVVFEVPNELLQEWHPINILLFYSYEVGDSKTEYRITIPVSPSKKPDGYAYTPSEVKTLDNLIARVEDLEKSGVGGVESSVKSVNGQTGEIELSAEDVGAISQDDLQNATNKALEQAKKSGEFDGKPGNTPYIGTNGNWWIGDDDTGVSAGGEGGAGYVASEEPPEDTEALWIDTAEPEEAVALGVTAVETAEGVDLYCTDELGTTKVSLRHGKDAGENASVFAGKMASFYGDSITEQNAHYTKGYHAWVKELLGLASYNNYGTSSYKVSNVYSKVNEVSDSADIVFAMCGVNDQTFSVPLGAMGDTTTGTTYGSLHLLCDALKTKYPTSVIVFITPAYQTKYPHNEGVTSYEVSKAIREVCQKFAIPVYDNFVLSGIYDTNLSVFTTDNCHWNDTGHEMVGKNLAAYMLDTFHYVHGYTGDGAGGEETPDETDKTLTGISATYSGGSVPVGTAVTALTGVVVTAHYSDGSTAAVTGYTLSGSTAEGANTITVTYEGMTATFTVTGVAESASTRIYAKDYNEEGGFWTTYGNIRTDLEGYTHTDYIPIGANVPFEIYTNVQAYMAFFDAEKKFISIANDGPPSQFTSVTGTTPANCAYFAFNMKSANRDQYYIEY